MAVLLIRKLWRLALKRLHGTSDQYATQRKILTIPNLITAVGLFGVVLYGYWAVRDPQAWYLFFVLGTLIILSDALDGLAADWCNQHSYLGKVLDPLRDRAFAAALLLHLWILHPIIWLIIPILLLVAVEMVQAFTFIRQRRQEVHAVGKTKTVSQWLTLSGCIAFYGSISDLVVIGVVCFVASLSAVTLAFYLCTKPG